MGARRRARRRSSQSLRKRQWRQNPAPRAALRGRHCQPATRGAPPRRSHAPFSPCHRSCPSTAPFEPRGTAAPSVWCRGKGLGCVRRKALYPAEGPGAAAPSLAPTRRHRVAKKKDPVCDGDALPAREGPARQQRRLHHVGARRRKDEPVLALEMRSRRWTPPRSPGRRRRAGWTYGHGLPAGSVVWYAPCLWQGGAERRDEPGAARVLRAEDLGRCERQAGGRWLS